MTKQEFISTFDAGNQSHRSKAKKIVLDPIVAERDVFIPNAPFGPSEPVGMQHQYGYNCPRAIFGVDGWKWAFSVEYFGD